jgi:hypothetical protein
MKIAPGRRSALLTMGLGVAAGVATLDEEAAARAAEPSLLPPHGKDGARPSFVKMIGMPEMACPGFPASPGRASNTPTGSA